MKMIKKKLNHKVKKIIALGLCIAMVALSIMACTSNGNSNGGSGNQEGNGSNGNGFGGGIDLAMGTGRFIETERNLPEGMVGIMDMVRLDDGTLRIIDQRGDLYDSIDDGASWSLSSVQYNLAVSDEIGVLGVALHPDGSAFIPYEEGHLFIHSNGEKTLVEIDLPLPAWAEEIEDMVEREMMRRLFQSRFTSDNYILGVGSMPDVLYLINPLTGEILQTFGEEGGHVFFQEFIQLNGKIVAITTEGLDIYDIETGSLVESEPALGEFFSTAEPGAMFFGGVGISHMRLFTGEDENTLYFVDSSGLYRYVLGGSQVEQLINGNLTLMGNPVYDFGSAIKMENNRFLISYASMAQQRLMYYHFDPDADVAPSEEITVFSMFDNPSIRQAVSTFQSQHPQLLVQFEVGLSAEETGLTASDVISSLNTRIMAGTGPDILILDGLPYEAYIRNGLLLPLSEVVGPLTEENEYFEQILEFGRTGDELYLVPISFYLLAAAGERGNLDDVMSLSDLADSVEELRRANPEIDSILGKQNAQSLMRALLHYVYPQMFNDDGTINEGVLTSYLEDVRRIFDLNMTPEARAEVENIGFGFQWGSVGGLLGDIEPRIGMDFTEIIGGEAFLSVGAITNSFELDMMLSINELADWDYRIRNEFVPSTMVGINSGSARIEESKEFLRSLLSAEVQTGAHFMGMPVMVEGIRARGEGGGEAHGSVAISTPEGETVSLDIYSASLEQLERIIEEARQVSIPSVPSLVVLDVILREGAPFIRGEGTLQEAIDGILGSVNLYLAE